MNEPAWEYDRCPKCHAQNSVELDGTTRLCIDCRHEWAPASTTGPLNVTPEALTRVPAPTLSVVPDTPALDGLDSYLAEARSRYLGAKVMVHELEVEGTVSEITDDGYACVMFGSGFHVFVMPHEFTVTDAAVIADETIAALATTDMSITAQVLRAAVATLAVFGDDRRLAMAPDGWLPDEPGIMPVVEHGAAYAVAYLAIQYGIATEDLTNMADMFDNAADAAKGAN